MVRNQTFIEKDGKDIQELMKPLVNHDNFQIFYEMHKKSMEKYKNKIIITGQQSKVPC